MNRRQLIRTAMLAIGGCALSACGMNLPRPGATTAIPRVGYIGPGSSIEPVIQQKFLEGLGDRGYVDGQSIFIDWRYAEANPDSLPGLVAELAARQVNVLVTRGAVPTVAARNAGTGIPIVMVGVEDPVGLGLVTTLGRPGGNITGFMAEPPGIAGKRLQLLLESLPQVRQVGVLWNPLEPTRATELTELQRASASTTAQLQSLEVPAADQLPTALTRSLELRSEAILVMPGFLLAGLQPRIAEFTNQHRLPSIYSGTTRVAAGGLMAYAPDIGDLHRRSATFVDRILKGAQPADLPVEQPEKFDLVINLRTAQDIGVTFPPSVLAQATEVIQ